MSLDQQILSHNAQQAALFQIRAGLAYSCTETLTLLTPLVYLLYCSPLLYHIRVMLFVVIWYFLSQEPLSYLTFKHNHNKNEYRFLPTLTRWCTNITCGLTDFYNFDIHTNGFLVGIFIDNYNLNSLNFLLYDPIFTLLLHVKRIHVRRYIFLPNIL